MFLSIFRAPPATHFEVGHSFVRHGDGGYLEKAEIVSLRHDEMGILHIHFRYLIVKHGRNVMSDVRTLAAPAFSRQFVH